MSLYGLKKVPLLNHSFSNLNLLILIYNLNLHTVILKKVIQSNPRSFVISRTNIYIFKITRNTFIIT